MADCIRKHPLTKAGRIIDESQPEEVQVQKHEEEHVTNENALHFENITKAKNVSCQDLWRRYEKAEKPPEREGRGEEKRRGDRFLTFII